MVLPDHFTPISTLTHARDPIPFTFCQKGGELKEGVVYSEKSAKKTGLVINEGHTIIDKFIKGF